MTGLNEESKMVSGHDQKPLSGCFGSQISASLKESGSMSQDAIDSGSARIVGIA